MCARCAVQIPYRCVEVNPLTKAEIKWSEYKKVPVILIDGEQASRVVCRRCCRCCCNTAGGASGVAAAAVAAAAVAAAAAAAAAAAPLLLLLLPPLYALLAVAR